MKRMIRVLILFLMLTLFIKIASCQKEGVAQEELSQSSLEQQAQEIKTQIKNDLADFKFGNQLVERRPERSVKVDLSKLGTKICPVMKPYKKTDPEFFVDYKDERINLCCDLCIKFFNKNSDFFYERMQKEKTEYLKEVVENKGILIDEKSSR